MLPGPVEELAGALAILRRHAQLDVVLDGALDAIAVLERRDTTG
ncbi:MAG TPA: hypothetical protein VFF06_29690 [Polyangia bacterium]|nr:hypothetical protein [Polyangia bacterium]